MGSLLYGDVSVMEIQTFVKSALDKRGNVLTLIQLFCEFIQNT